MLVGVDRLNYIKLYRLNQVAQMHANCFAMVSEQVIVLFGTLWLRVRYIVSRQLVSC